MNSSRLNSGHIYGRVVPVLGILLGVSWALGAPQPVRTVLLGALIVCASVGWVFGGGCCSSRAKRRGERRDSSESGEPRPEPAQGPQDVLPGDSGQARMNAR